MIKTKMLIALLVASPFISALAKTSQWNNWYISTDVLQFILNSKMVVY